MSGQLADLLTVQASLWLLFALPPLPAMKRWAGRSSRPVVLLLSVCAGISLQGVVGAAWNGLVGCCPQGALCVPLLFWLVAAMTACRKPDTCIANAAARLPVGQAAMLAGLLLLALAIRSIHPLQHAFLGQSDAYIHLTFIKDIIRDGHMRHPGYPPGYHWIMAAPSLAWGTDPYVTARYGGAFFGVLLTLAAYSFWAMDGNKRAGLFSAFCVAGLPAFTLLIKTGVGAMANQMGLALLPAFLTFYPRPSSTGPPPATRAAVLSLTAAGLLVSVPLMFVSLFLVIVADFVLRLIGGKHGRTVAFGSAILLLLFIGLCVLVLYFVNLGGAFLAVTARAMTGRVPTRPSGVAALWLMALNFLQPKRWGLASPPLNLAGIALLAGFAWLLLSAIRARSTRTRLLALFGLLAAIQTLTGAFEFSLYQRAGWNLLLAAAWLGGMIGEAVYTRLEHRRHARHALAAALAVALLAAFLHPPEHRKSLSTAEDELVDLTRSLAELEAARTNKQLAWSFSRPSFPLCVSSSESEQPLALVLRTTSDSDGYWEIPDAVLPPGSDLRIIYVRGKKRPKIRPEHGCRYVFFLDREEKIPPERLGAFGLVDPAQAENYSEWQASLYARNGQIREALAELPADRWEVRWKVISANAEIALVNKR